MTGLPPTPPVVLASRTPFEWASLRPARSTVIIFGSVFAGFAVLAIVVMSWVVVVSVLIVFALILGTVVLSNFRRTNGTAWADPSGVSWSGRYGSYAFGWPQIRWIELGRDQPGGTVFNVLDPESTTRTGTRIGVTVVVENTPHYIHPVWSASDRARIDFGCALADYARAQGVRVRVLAGDWGAENANREAGVGGWSR